jgi:Flp pilus assembly protein TadD
MPQLRLKLTWSLVLLALPLAAQHQEAPINAEFWDSSARVSADPSPIRETSAARTVSAELLRYPLSGKALRMLQKALHSSETGDHAAAIQELQTTLIKCPGTGAYVYSLLGVEYLRTGQLPEAVDVLERAVNLLPHDASNHANLGLALACRGQYERAQPELRRALELDPHNKVASQLVGRLELSKNTQK